MRKTRRQPFKTCKKSQIEQAEVRIEQAESRTEQAKTRTELAETRTEEAETRTDLAKTRTEQAESRTERAETRTEEAEAALQIAVRTKAGPDKNLSRTLLKRNAANGFASIPSALQSLTIRQREVLQLIAEGQNTKQIGGILKVSPKTVEYHRMKLMAGLNLVDIPSLVRFALRAGLIPSES